MIKDIIIDESWAHQRFDRFLRKYFKGQNEVSLNDIFSRIRKGSIRLNGKKAKENVSLQEQDHISFHIADNDLHKIIKSKEDKKKTISEKDIQKLILYEDDQWIWRKKPAHMVVHPGSKHEKDISLHDILQIYTSSYHTSTFSPSFCYRLDKTTSWVMIAAKTYPALQLLNQLIRDRKVNKQYLAIVEGKTPAQGDINDPLFIWFNKKTWRGQTFINKEKWVDAHTSFITKQQKKDKYLGDISLLEVILHTWRMHQIRAHLAHYWYPILGDIDYGKNATTRLLHKNYKINRQLLHAHHYSFFDSIQNKTISITSPIPEDFLMLFSNTKRSH